jgi:hypothetical protein
METCQFSHAFKDYDVYTDMDEARLACCTFVAFDSVCSDKVLKALEGKWLLVENQTQMVCKRWEAYSFECTP